MATDLGVIACPAVGDLGRDVEAGPADASVLAARRHAVVLLGCCRQCRGLRGSCSGRAAIAGVGIGGGWQWWGGSHRGPRGEGARSGGVSPGALLCIELGLECGRYGGRQGLALVWRTGKRVTVYIQRSPLCVTNRPKPLRLILRGRQALYPIWSAPWPAP